MGTKTQQQHDHDVRKIQEELNRSQQKGGLCLARDPRRSNTTRQSHYASGRRRLDLSSLKKVISIDPVKKEAVVEPGITMEALVAATLPYEMAPAVLPEFRGITVGGAIMGAALESSSFRYGQFNDICKEIEVLLADGTSLVTSPEQNSQLFYALPGSYGSLALITQVTLSLVSVPREVCLEYHLASSRQEAVALLGTLSREPDTEYIEGVALDSTTVVVIRGSYAKKGSYTAMSAPLIQLSRPWSPWFCQHIARQATRLIQREGVGVLADRMPIKDYLFRLDKGAFWMGRYSTPWQLWKLIFLRWQAKAKDFHTTVRKILAKGSATIEPSLWQRILLAGKVGSKALYGIWHELTDEALEDLFVVQDFYIPIDKVATFIEKIEEKSAIYPLWLCPIKGVSTPQFLSPHALTANEEGEGPHFINVGVYGHPKEATAAEVTQYLEECARGLGGRKMLYARTYYNPEVFWGIYDKSRYEAMREGCRAKGTLLDLYEKVTSR